MNRNVNTAAGRYLILAAAAIVNFVHGNPYIWTVFQPYVMEEYGLSTAASSQPFTIIIGVFAFGNMAGGVLQHKIGAKRTIFLGSAVMCGGFLLAALAPLHMPWLISLGYGALGGLGSGCAFSMLTAVPQAWFPDRKGLVTGITIGMVGLSGVLMNPLCDYALSLKGYRAAMLMATAIYAVLSLGAVFITEAPEEFRAGDTFVPDKPSAPAQKQYTAREMMKTKTYYAISLTMALAVPAYVLVNPLMKSLGMERGLTNSQALSGVMAASVGNIVGRFALPWLSDKIGRKRILRAIYLLAAVSVFGLTAARGLPFILMISAVCFVYGGVVSVIPVIVSDLFGTKHQGTNFGAVMIGYGIVSILCPYLLDIAGQEVSFVIAGIASIAGLVSMRFF